MLGRAVQKVAAGRDIPIKAFGSRDFDVTNYATFGIGDKTQSEDTIINCAGIVRANQHDSPLDTVAVNSMAPHLLAYHYKRVIQVSTDCVFSGQNMPVGSLVATSPYIESDRPSPTDFYSKTKLAGELTEGYGHQDHLTVRCSFVGFGKRGLLAWLVGHKAGSTVPGFTNSYWNGLFVTQIAEILLKLAIYPTTFPRNLLHVHGAERWTKAELLSMVKNMLNLDVTIDKVENVPISMILESRNWTHFAWHMGAMPDGVSIQELLNGFFEWRSEV